MIRVDVRKRLERFSLEVAFTAQGAETTALFGPSGCGKSSLIRMIAGLDRPDAGRIALGEKTLFDGDRRIDLPPEQRRLGCVFQEGFLFPHLSVRDNLLYGHRIKRGTGRAAAFSQDLIVDLLELAPLLSRKPTRLSGGERQRVALGRALLSAPEMLLMDEPLAALDARRRMDILPFLERVRDEFRTPTLYVSHALEEVLRLADRMVVLADGRVADSGPVEAVANRMDPQRHGGWDQAGTVLSATVAEQDDRWGQTRLDLINGQALLLPRLNKPLGARVRLRILARDVTLMLAEPQQTSALNHLRGTVTSIDPAQDPDVMVTLALAAGAGAEAQALSLRARITRKSAAALRLQPGGTVWASIKSIAISRESGGT